MPISRFDEGTLSDALVVYYNGAESAIDKTGDVINTVDSVYGLATCQLTQLTATTNNVLHDGTTMIGAVPAFIGPTAANDTGLVGTLSAGFAHDANGATIVSLEDRSSKAPGCTVAIGNGTSGDKRLAIRGGDPNLALYIDNAATSHTPQVLTKTVPAVWLVRSQNSPGNPAAHTRSDTDAEVPNNRTSSLAGETISQVTLLNNSAGDDEAQGNIAIVAIYNRRLTDQECLDVMELMDHWRLNGEAPGEITPNTTFGPVATNDDASVTGWQWEESATGNENDWADVGTILTDISGATTTTLTVNSAPLSADQTRVRCKAVTDNQPNGVFSHSAILTVQA